MLPLILGLMSGAPSSEISRLMSETTEHHKKEADEIQKLEEESKRKRREEYQRFTEIEDNVLDTFVKYNTRCVNSNDPDLISEPIFNCLEYTCDKLKIDKILFYTTFKKYFDEYWDDY